MFPLVLQFAHFYKIASVFAFQIKEWFQFNMLKAHLLVIKIVLMTYIIILMIISHQKNIGFVFEAAVAYLSRKSWQLWSRAILYVKIIPH